MFDHILIGFDGTPASRDALALGTHIAARTGSRLTLAACFPHPGSIPPERMSMPKDESEPLFRIARTLAPDAEFETVAIADADPAAVLADVASERGADLIVIGSTHRGTVGRVLPGSLGDRLLHSSPVAVAVAPKDYAAHNHADIGLIGVAFDGSPESRLAVRTAGRLARRLGSRIRVISVIDLSGRRPGFMQLSKVASGDFDSEVESGARLVGDDIEHDLVVLEGEPAVEIAAQGVELDLLLIGSSGHGRIGHVLLGSVSSEVMRTAPCPVIALPRLACESGAGEPSLQEKGVPR